jgi:hypothetical protein
MCAGVTGTSLKHQLEQQGCSSHCEEGAEGAQRDEGCSKLLA